MPAALNAEPLDTEDLLLGGCAPRPPQPTGAVRTGEIKLLWAILVQGVEAYCREVSRGTMDSLAYREADRWIFRPDSDALTSFSNLCEVFCIDQHRLRRGLLRFRANPDRNAFERLNGQTRSLLET